jgi:1,4-alpha-glucan branching enzyme
MNTTIDIDEIFRVVRNEHYDPFKVLGLHILERGKKKQVVIRAFLPESKSASVLELGSDGKPKGTEIPMVKIMEEGFYEVVIANRTDVFPYKLKKVTQADTEETFYDSYSFLPTLTDFDLHLFGAGDHHRIYEKLGAHYAEINGIGGVQFAVWAPNARSVSVIGDFNFWNPRWHAMRVLGSSGVWEIFIPGIAEGANYKFNIRTQDGEVLDKTDPYATEMEHRPRTASKINFLRGFRWSDDEWMAERKKSDHLGKPISIYEVHLGSWARVPEENNRWLTYRELSERLVEYVVQRGFTHVELMPVMEYPFDGSWGYQVTGYFAPTSRFGTPQEFMGFVNECHRHNIGVLLDWVPAHFPKDAHALARFDGTHLYEHADPRKGEHQDWGSLIFNYGRNEVRNFLLSNALYWLEHYHIDGLRIDAVASMLYLDYSRKAGEWIPNQYGGRENLEALSLLKHLNDVVRQDHPGVLMIAEESTAWPGVTAETGSGGLGFHLKWNMGWMHDTLEYFSKDPIHRKHHQGSLTFALLYAFTERFLLPLSHDEVVHGKSSLIYRMPGDDWQRFANLRALYGLMFGFPGKKLLFMGGEFGQTSEWNHDSSLEWHLLQYPPHAGVQRWIDDLNHAYKSLEALHQVDFHYTGFEWIDFQDKQNSVLAFIRHSVEEKESVVVVCNLTPVPRFGYNIGISDPGTYRELLNSDSEYYGGSNVGNTGTVKTQPLPCHGRDHSLSLNLPPLGVIFLKKDEI